MLVMLPTTPPAPDSVHRFEAIGDEVLVGGATDAELGAIRRLFERRERALGVHVPDSELRWVNRSDAPIVAVSALLAETLADALEAARETGGLVSPVAGPAPAGGAEPVLRLAGRLLLRPPGLELDLDGVARGRAVDDAVRLIAGPGFVAAGPDVATRTGAVVALPGGGTLHVRRGGLATATAASVPAAAEPRWRSVTVAAAGARHAGVAARAALGLGAAGPAWLDAHDLPGRFIGADGAVANRRWRAATAVLAPLPGPPLGRPQPIDIPGEPRS
jgi:thiamine biosynthesis lipoprotein ApbE